MKNFLLSFVFVFIVQFTFAQATESAIKSLPIEFSVVEQRPEFPGGNAEFSKFISKNFKSPEVEGLSGVVTITFIIELDGSITDIRIIKDLGSGAGAAAVAMIKKSPKWTAGQNNGLPVRVRYSLPITIRG